MMRFLANENIPFDAVRAIESAGFDVRWIRRTDPDATDEDVLACAIRAKRILPTFDKDFGKLAQQRNLPNDTGVLLFRISTHSSVEVAQLILDTIQSRDDWAGHFSVIHRNRIRMRKLRRV